jgi:hypothetical protein
MSYGLFDFSANNTNRGFHDYYISKNGFFLLNLNTSEVFEVEKFGANNLTKHLKKLEINVDTRQIIDHNEGENISDCLWMQIVQPYNYLIKEGDQLRLGKQKLIVKSIKLFNNSQSRLQAHDSNGMVQSQNLLNRFKPVKSLYSDRMCVVEEQESIEKGTSCRICLEGDSTTDPFVNICKCSKHMPIHLSCVKEWLNKKVKTTRSNNVFYCNLQEIKCEVCQMDYPASVFYQGQEISLLDFQLNKTKPHIMFDICCRETGVNKGYVVIYFEEKNSMYTIGRAETNNITFNDSSVSREHAFMTIDDKGVFVSDRGSKYGTLVKISNYNYQRFEEHSFFQIDKFLFEIHPFVREKCGCNISKRIEITKNPFRSIQEFEINIPPPNPITQSLVALPAGDAIRNQLVPKNKGISSNYVATSLNEMPIITTNKVVSNNNTNQVSRSQGPNELVNVIKPRTMELEEAHINHLDLSNRELFLDNFKNRSLVNENSMQRRSMYNLKTGNGQINPTIRIFDENDNRQNFINPILNTSEHNLSQNHLIPTQTPNRLKETEFLRKSNMELNYSYHDNSGLKKDLFQNSQLSFKKTKKDDNRFLIFEKRFKPEEQSVGEENSLLRDASEINYNFF